MTSKVTVSVADDASHSVRVTRVATPTGQEYEGRVVEAGQEETFDLENEQRLDINQDAATVEKEEGDKAGKKK